MIKSLVLLAVVLSPLWVQANVFWSVNGPTPPRHYDVVTEDEKPCGSAEPSTPVVLESGSEISAEWEELIWQSGRFEIYFSSADDSDWVLLETISNDQPLGDGIQLHEHKIKLPETTCNNCTLQIIQVVDNLGSEARYYSCADIQLKGQTKSENIEGKDFCPVDQ